MPGFAHWKPKGWCGRLWYINGGQWGANSTSDTYPDGGCGQPSQRYYHVPPDWLVAAPATNALLLAESEGSPAADTARVQVVSRN